MRLLTFDDGNGPRAGILVGEEVVPVTALDAPAGSVKGLLEALDADGLADLGEPSERRAGADRALRRAAARAGAGPREDHLPGPELPRPRGGVRPGDPSRAAVVRASSRTR